MNKETRTYKSIVNIFFGFMNQIIILLLQFASKTLFIHTLGVEYLGINGLYTNILTVLSISELGFGVAIVYSLYEPLKNNDKKEISALMNYYKKIYNIIAVVIAIIGIALIPFLRYIVNTDLELNKLILYYVLFLINTVASYLFIYKASLLNADQKSYIQKKYSTSFLILQFILQIIILYTIKNYVLYLITYIVCTLLNNITISRKVNKLYPYIKNKEELDKDKKKKVLSDSKDLLIYKVSGIILNNTDNILISILIGTVWVGYYSNYYMIINGISALMLTIFSAMTGTVGNLMLDEDKQKKEKVFYVLNIFSTWIFGMSAIILLVNINDFINLWIGEQYILDWKIVFTIILNFYIVGILNPIWLFRDASGMFKDMKVLSILNAVINIILSIILGKIYGMFGIFLATVISRFTTVFMPQPPKIYKKIFGIKSSKYYIQHVLSICILILSFAISAYITQFINGISILAMIIKSLIIIVITTVLFIVFFKGTGFNEYIIDLLKKIFKSKKYNEAS